MPAYPGLTMLVYTVEAGSRTQEALGLLASWIGTPGTLHDVEPTTTPGIDAGGASPQ